MWLAFACGFPPLIADQFFPLHIANSTVIQEFYAPITKPYILRIRFEFPSAQARLATIFPATVNAKVALMTILKLPQLIGQVWIDVCQFTC